MLLSAESALPCVAENERASTTQAADPGGSLRQPLSFLLTFINERLGLDSNHRPLVFQASASIIRLLSYPTRFTSVGRLELPASASAVQRSLFQLSYTDSKLQGRDSNPRHPT
jgi:hypothetical protein